MLLKNQKEDTTDYTKDWPARYYDIPTGALRREHLKRARSEGFAVPTDSYREMLCERRFFSANKDGTVDCFFHAWTMIKASAAAGVSFFQKKRQKKELLTYMICFPNPRMRFSSKSGRILRGDSSLPAPGVRPTVRRSLALCRSRTPRWRKSSLQRFFW